MCNLPFLLRPVSSQNVAKTAPSQTFGQNLRLNGFGNRLTPATFDNPFANGAFHSLLLFMVVFSQGSAKQVNVGVDALQDSLETCPCLSRVGRAAVRFALDCVQKMLGGLHVGIEKSSNARFQIIIEGGVKLRIGGGHSKLSLFPKELCLPLEMGGHIVTQHLDVRAAPAKSSPHLL